jgi:hypothetical protein
MDAGRGRGGANREFVFILYYFLNGSKPIKERNIPNINTKN